MRIRKNIVFGHFRRSVSLLIFRGYCYIANNTNIYRIYKSFENILLIRFL